MKSYLGKHFIGTHSSVVCLQMVPLSNSRHPRYQSDLLFPQNWDPTTFVHLSLESEPISEPSSAVMTTITGCVTPPIHWFLPLVVAVWALIWTDHMTRKSSATGQSREEQRWRQGPHVCGWTRISSALAPSHRVPFLFLCFHPVSFLVF